MGRLSCGTIDAGKAPQQGANSPRRESGGRPRAQKPATGVNANPVAFVERSCIIDGEAVACNNNGVACLPSGTARIEPVVLPSTVARVEGLVGRRDLPGATNAVEAVKPKGLHQVNRPIA